MEPISEHAFTCAAIQAFYLVKHSAKEMIFGESEEQQQAGAEDSKKVKKGNKKKNAWKLLKGKIDKKEDAKLDMLKKGVHEKIRFSCCDYFLLFLS